MKDFKSLAHTRWDCKSHVVFIPSPNISSVGNESPKRWLIDESGLQLRRLCG